VASTILIWIVIVCTIIAAIVFGIFLLRCICRYIWKIHLNNNNSTHSGNAYNGNFINIFRNCNALDNINSGVDDPPPSATGTSASSRVGSY
jgi:hypothetical protein